jgi:sulfate/thiosulfate transport system ATP-binding protein
MPDVTPSAQRPHGMRALLDARSEAQAVHGLEMRTELRFGDVAYELARQLAEAPGQMLILGVCEVARLVERFGSLLESARWPVLIVRRDHEGEAAHAHRAPPAIVEDREVRLSTGTDRRGDRG